MLDYSYIGVGNMRYLITQFQKFKAIVRGLGMYFQRFRPFKDTKTRNIELKFG